MIKIVFLVLVVPLMALLIWVIPTQPKRKMMTKRDHEELMRLRTLSSKHTKKQ